MTIGSQVKQTIASLKGAEATLRMYAQRSQKEEVQKICERNADKVKNVIGNLQKRVQRLEFEEPQYKGF